MPLAPTDGGSLHYEVDGDAGASALILSNSLGTALSMWDANVPAWREVFRVIRYDTRGHGRSLVTPGPYTIERLGRDVLAVADHLSIDRFHFAGISMGGMTGMWLGANAGDRVEKLILANTAAKLGTAESWNERIEKVRNGGMAAIADAVIQRWFTPDFQHQSPDAVERTKRLLLNTPPKGYAACCCAIRDMDQRGDLALIVAPTLVIAGDADPATPPAACREVAEAIRGARLHEVRAAHLSNIEAASAFNAAVTDFLNG